MPGSAAHLLSRRLLPHGAAALQGAAASGHRVRDAGALRRDRRHPGIYLEMDFAPGDIQLLSNHTVLHARSEYVDHDEPERKRHLLRLWLSLPSQRALGELPSLAEEGVRLLSTLLWGRLRDRPKTLTLARIPAGFQARLRGRVACLVVAQVAGCPHPRFPQSFPRPQAAPKEVPTSPPEIECWGWLIACSEFRCRLHLGIAARPRDAGLAKAAFGITTSTLPIFLASPESSSRSLGILVVVHSVRGGDVP